MTTLTDKQSALASEALANARGRSSIFNYGAIFAGFAEKGIPEADILPRQNVFTFNAWRALGRTVKKGEHGVKVVTFVPMGEKDDGTGEKVATFRAPRTTTVFHVSQTKPLNEEG
jgi:hypothetical protein